MVGKGWEVDCDVARYRAFDGGRLLQLHPFKCVSKGSFQRSAPLGDDNGGTSGSGGEICLDRGGSRASDAARECPLYEGEFQAALEVYEKLEANPPEGFADVPTVGKAQCLEALKKYDDALVLYTNFAESKPKSFLAKTARLGEERCVAALKGDKSKVVPAVKEDAVTEALKAVEPEKK